MKKGQFLTFKLTGRKDTISGVILNINTEWIVIRRCVDYRLDGYSIFENNNKLAYESGQYEKRASAILKKKKYRYSQETIMPIDDINTMLEVISKQYFLIQLDTKKGDAFDVVKFIGKKNQSFLFKELTTDVKWRYNLELTKKELAVISFDTDYLNSLKLLL